MVPFMTGIGIVQDGEVLTIFCNDALQDGPALWGRQQRVAIAPYPQPGNRRPEGHVVLLAEKNVDARHVGTAEFRASSYLTGNRTRLVRRGET